MFSVQRYALYFTLAVCILITLTYYRADFWSPSPHHAHFPSAGTDSKPQHLGAGSADKNFQWRTVPTNYPVTSFTPLPTDKPLKLPKIQHDFPKENQEQSKKRKERQATVRKSFERTWNAYRQHAWLKDELAPLSGGTKGTNYRTDPPSLFRNTLTPFAVCLKPLQTGFRKVSCRIFFLRAELPIEL
jgi:mannosyl-oligosaccharide alpha-1,2-mannosidase